MKPVFMIIALLTTTMLTKAAIGTDHIRPRPAWQPNWFDLAESMDWFDNTCFGFQQDGQGYQVGTCLDLGVTLYSVRLGDVFVPSSQTFQRIDGFGTHAFAPIFYLGVETPSRDIPGAWTRACGWAGFSNSGGSFSVLDHAIDYSGQGLIVGTTTVVPEPSVARLLFPAGFGLVMVRKRTHRQVLATVESVRT